jgi:hypothetical protein
MKWPLLLLLCVPFSVQAATGTAGVDHWYLRPAAACAHSGDGLSYGCAASAGAPGAFISSATSNLIWTPVTGIDDGDTLYICGMHDTAVPIGAAAGSASAHIAIDFNCPSDRGSIRRITNMTEALSSVRWTNEGGSLWYLSVSSYSWKDPRRVWIDGTEIFPSDTKANLGVAQGGGPLGQFWYDSANARVYLHSASNPASTMSGFQSLAAGASACAYAALCFTSTTNAYFDVINPILWGGNLASLYILGAHDIRVYGTTADDSSCMIGWNSSRGALISDTSTAGTGTPSSNITIRDCTIDPNLPTYLTHYVWYWNQGNGDGVALVYGTSGDLIASNTIKNWGHVQVNMAATLGTGAVTGNRVEGNNLTCDPHVEYCRGFAIDGAALGRASGNYVSSNVINGATIRSQLNGNGNYVVGNMFQNQRSGTVKPAAVQSLDMEGYAGPSQDNFILNNTFLNNTVGPCISFRVGANKKSGYVVSGNLLYNCGGAAVAGYEQAALVLENAPSVGDQAFTNNHIHDAAQTNTVFYKSTGLTTVAGFQAACSGDVCSGNLASPSAPGDVTPPARPRNMAVQ